MVKTLNISDILKKAREICPDFIIVSTPELQGYRILEYLEPVCICVSGTTGNFSDVKAQFSKMLGGGQTRDYELAYKGLVAIATEQAADYALSIGATAIIDIEPAITSVGASSLLIVLHGTYVIAERLEENRLSRMETAVRAQESAPLEKEESREAPPTASSTPVIRPTSNVEPIENTYRGSGVKTHANQEVETGQHVTVVRDSLGKVRFTPVGK